MSNYTGSTPDTDPAGQWVKQAVCAQLDAPDAMFPDSNAADIADAKAICNACPVIEPCLQAALDEEGDKGASYRHGIRGGQTKTQRRRAYEKRLTAAQVLEQQKLRTTPNPDELRDLYDKHTEPTPDGHLIWTGSYPVVGLRDMRLTVGKLAFQIGHGRTPEGLALRACDRDRCVAPGCLTDREIREPLKAAA